MSADWQVGDRALCVDARTPTEDGYVPERIEEGVIYTVYAVGRDPFGDLGLFLDEVDSLGHAGGFLAFRFRKIEPDATDIARQEKVEA